MVLISWKNSEKDSLIETNVLWHLQYGVLNEFLRSIHEVPRMRLLGVIR